MKIHPKKHQRTSFFTFGLLLFLAVLSSISCTKTETNEDSFLSSPRLIVLLVVDQFRADYLLRYREHFLPARSLDGKPGGFRYLMEQGAYYPFARHDVMQAMTGPGHATLASGAYPYRSGIPLNKWYDAENRSPMYAVGDERFSLVGTTGEGPNVGTGPLNLLGSTIGDELKNAGGKSRVVSISIKDRAAILMGGTRADAAIWFDKKTFHWVSSRLYCPEGALPSWVARQNADLDKHRGETHHWSNESVLCEYSDDGTASFSKTYKSNGKEALFGPAGNELTQKAALEALKSYELGNREATDLLAVSFSVHDYLGHDIGPNRCEMEALTFHLDVMLSELFTEIDRSVPGGLDNVLVVLTGDHGVAPTPKYLKSKGFEAAVLDEKKLQQDAENSLQTLHGIPENGEWIVYSKDFNFFLNKEATISKGISIEDLENDLKRILLRNKNVLFAFSASDVLKNRLPSLMWERQIRHSYFPGRSGDVVAIPKPYVIDEAYETTHITGYTYDATVPLMFAGQGIRPGVYSTPAEAVDIAPTIAFLTRVLPPTLNEGRVLSEILTQ